MIVIATNNGYSQHISKVDNQLRVRSIENILNSIESIGYLDDVLVMDTGSTNLESIEYLKSLKDNNPFSFNLMIDEFVGNYPTGAYISAFKKYKSEYYIFLQDSMSIKDPNFVQEVENRLTDNNVVCLFECKTCGYDNDQQREFVYNSIGETEYDTLIFGPVFFAKHDVLGRVFDQIKILPTTKPEESGMERAFGVLFKKNGIDVVAMEGEYDYFKMVYDQTKYVTKYHLDRQ